MEKKTIIEKEIVIETDFLKKNDEIAERVKKMLESQQVRAYDIMGSVGAGKSSLIISLVKRLKNEKRIYAIAGDLTTHIDADRIKNAGAEVVQINTGRECHLNANTIYESISRINLKNYDLIFIENVGNLICPADFNLGTNKRIVVISVTEGPHMVLKHPYTFWSADIVAINKTDLAGYVEVDPNKLERDLKHVNPRAKVYKCSCKTGEGIENLIGEMLK